MSRAVPRALALLAVAVAAGALVSAARADGDPASDYLLGQQVFFPYDVKFPAERQAQFAGLVAAANRAGFKIRVALIGSSYDMGSVTSLYRKPRSYARFLGAEISLVYRQRLLVVMPNGLGFNWPAHSTVGDYALLDEIPVKQGPAGLLATAETAVERLAAADGIKVAVPTHLTTPAERNSHDRSIIIAVIVAALVLAVTARLALRLRRQSSQSR